MSQLSRPARTSAGTLAAAVLLASVVAANWATTRFGFVPVGFGQTATAGTFAAGAAFAARDALQDILGKAVMLTVIAVAAALSLAVAEPAIAVASAVAFAVAEVINFAVYTPLREKAVFGGGRWAGAVAVSSLIGAVVDTAAFLWIAFGAAAVLPALIGQIIGKVWASGAYMVLGRVGSFAVLRQSHRQPAGA